MNIQPCIVFIKTDEQNKIIDVNSSELLLSTDGWTEIDSGTGCKYNHAQHNYFDKPIIDERGVCQYQEYQISDVPTACKQIKEFEKNGETHVIVERTQSEMDSDFASRPPAPPSDKERIAALEAQLEAAKILLGVE